MAEESEIDLLICGTCGMTFPLGLITTFMNHKKLDCDDNADGGERPLKGKSGYLICQSCLNGFRTPWDLLFHVQNTHGITIYNLSGLAVENKTSHLVSTKSMGTMTEELLLNGQTDEQKQESPTETEHVSPVAVYTNPPEVIEVQGEAEADIHKTQETRLNPTDTDQTPKDEPTNAAEEADTTSKNGDAAPTEEPAAEQAEASCCNDQDCGVTLMPGTHKSLEKCCSAIIPKKRKRHMEIKHMTSGGKSKRREKGQSYKLADKSRCNTTRDIFIDVNPQVADEQSVVVSSRDGGEAGTKHGEENVTISRSSIGEQRSVIIQPGSTLSIPFSSSSQVFFSYPPENKPAAQSRRLTGERNARRSEPAPALSNALTSPSKLPGTTEESLDQSLTKPEQESSEKQRTNSPRDNGRKLKQKKRRYPTSRPFKCDECDHAFNQRIHLKKHQSKHTGVKPFKCDQCDYSTVERSHLKVHIRVHTGEKPFKCTYCEYATAQNSTLKIHLQRHHNLAKPMENLNMSPGKSGHETPAKSFSPGVDSGHIIVTDNTEQRSPGQSSSPNRTIEHTPVKSELHDQSR